MRAEKLIEFLRNFALASIMGVNVSRWVENISSSTKSHKRINFWTAFIISTNWCLVCKWVHFHSQRGAQWVHSINGISEKILPFAALCVFYCVLLRERTKTDTITEKERKNEKDGKPCCSFLQDWQIEPKKWEWGNGKKY